MESKKQRKSRYQKRKIESEENDFKIKIKNITAKLSQLEKRDFWYYHLPWPKFLRKPRIRFVAPRISGSFPIPNRTIMFVIALFLVGFSIAGGAYDIVSKSTGKIAVGYDTSVQPARAIFFYQGIHDQFMLEGIIAFALICCGFIGFLFIHQSTKHFYRPKYSYMLFAVGIGLILFSFFSMTMIVLNGKNINMYSPRF